jgi:hypothetical protein
MSKWISNNFTPKLTVRNIHNIKLPSTHNSHNPIYSSFILHFSFIYIILCFNILITQCTQDLVILRH